MRDRLTRTLLVLGVVAGPLFLVTLFAAGATRDHYETMRHPGSSLELGPYGWVQRANFVVAGLLTLALAVGLRRALRPGRRARSAPVLIGVWAVGLIGAGVFVTDPVNGYPPGTPNVVAQPTVHGSMHDLLSLLGFVALGVAFLVLARRFMADDRRVWAAYSVGTALVFALGFGLSNAGFQQADRLVAVGGLWQRVAVIAAFGWLTVLAARFLRRPTPYPQPPPPPAAVLAHVG